MKVKILLLFHQCFPAHRQLSERKDLLAFRRFGVVRGVEGKV